MNITDIITFTFDGTNRMRTLILEGEPWFVAADVCRILGLENASSAVAPLADDEKAKFFLGNADDGELGPGNPNVNIINESGLYTLVLRSRDAITPGTVAFRLRRFVTGEVLPSIRKKGFYGQPQYQDLLDDPKQRAKFAAIERKAVDGYNAMHHLMLHLSAQMLSLGEPSQRFLTHQVLQKVCGEMGVDCPAMETMGQDRPEVPDIVLNFWEAFEDLPNRDQMNHSAESGEIAINLPQLREHMSKQEPRVQIDLVLKQALRGSRRPYPQFVETKPVRSVHTKEPIRCWVFKV